MVYNRRDNRRVKEEPEFKEKLITVNRVSKTVKGGRRLSFAAFSAVGDEKGNVGIGLGKAANVPDAVRKSIVQAKKTMNKISLKGLTIPHEVVGEFGATRIILKPAGEGRGIIAGSSAREILKVLGVHNVFGKIIGSKNKLNVAKATIDGLLQLKTAEEIFALRFKDKAVSETND